RRPRLVFSPLCPAKAGIQKAWVPAFAGTNGGRAERLLLHLQRQAYGLAGSRRPLDSNRRLQINPRLLRRGVDRRGAGCEMVEPSARLVAERSPEIAAPPIAGRVRPGQSLV